MLTLRYLSYTYTSLIPFVFPEIRIDQFSDRYESLKIGTYDMYLCYRYTKTKMQALLATYPKEFIVDIIGKFTDITPRDYKKALLMAVYIKDKSIFDGSTIMTEIAFDYIGQQIVL